MIFFLKMFEMLRGHKMSLFPALHRFTIDCLGSNHQQLSCISKSTTKLLEKFRHEDLFSFRREDFGGESVSMYILSLQVFVVHRVILYKLMKEKLCDEFETPCIPHESGIIYALYLVDSSSITFA